MPVPLSQLVAGPQIVRISSDVDMVVQNVNIVLVAAAPVPPVEGSLPPALPTNLRIVP